MGLRVGGGAPEARVDDQAHLARVRVRGRVRVSVRVRGRGRVRGRRVDDQAHPLDGQRGLGEVRREHLV